VKPSKGLISATGMVPACRSLDTISIFALTVADGMAVLDVAAAADPADFLSRTMSGPIALTAAPPTFRFGVPRPEDRIFFDDKEAERAFDAAIARLTALGGTAVDVDFRPLAEVARLLYAGPWVAERWAAVGDFATARPESVYPVTLGIVEGAKAYDAAAAFKGTYRLAELAKQVAPIWNRIDVLLVPSAPTHYTVAELMADPLVPNANLGTYTNFVNFLDMCGLSVPNGFRADGLPTGITLLAPALRDTAIAALGARYHADLGGTLGKSAAGVPAAPEPAPVAPPGTLPLAVVGAHLSGFPLNRQLLELGSTFLRSTRTAPEYKLYALANRVPPAPGMVRVPGGAALEVEVWAVPLAGVGSFLAGIAPPLGLGTVQLEDGSAVKGFLCEAWGLQGAEDITRFGGWRAWMAARAA
jgi:allophanate hydrolase